MITELTIFILCCDRVPQVRTYVPSKTVNTKNMIKMVWQKLKLLHYKSGSRHI